MPTVPSVPTSHTPPQTLTRSADPCHAPRREDCPWCGSRSLRTRVRAAAEGRYGPGACAVDECRDCGHVFQNPRLTAEGLALHHRDFHEGRLEDFAERVLSPRAVRRRHRAAARAVLPLADPESWLDVGTGYGSFPETAKEVFPYTSFDGHDPTHRVAKALLEERVEEAHQGELTAPELLARLRGRYDVVSMFHHLEHTPDPRAELRAALGALRPGGHLLIEVPDPRCAFAPLLGRRWLPYGQPRHLHLMPLRNLCAELTERGCTVLSTHRSAPHLPYDVAAAVSLSVAHAHPALRATATPLIGLASALDHTLAPLLRHTPFANSYRILARKN
ncbi:class I SAM-dependent methyltransferase [Streptomyces sp. NPDC001606]